MKTDAHSHSHYIVGRNARDLKIVTARSSSGMTCPTRAGGTRKQMEQVLVEAVRHWTNLPAGKEIEETAARLIKPDLALVPDEVVDSTLPAERSSPAQRRRATQQDVTHALHEIGAPAAV